METFEIISQLTIGFLSDPIILIFFSFFLVSLAHHPNFHLYLQFSLLSSIILDKDRELIRHLAIVTTMELNDFMVMVDFLTFNFKLTFLVVVSQEDEESHDAGEKQSCHGTSSYTRCFKHHSRSCGCLEGRKKIIVRKVTLSFRFKTYINMSRRDPCSRIAVL